MGWQADSTTGSVSTNAAVTPITIPTGLLSNPASTGTVALTGNLNTAASASATDSIDSMTFPIYDKQGNSSDIGLTFSPIAGASVSTISSWSVHGTYGNPQQTFDGVVSVNLSTHTVSSIAISAQSGLTASATGDDIALSLTGSDGNAFTPTIDLSKLTATAQSGDTSSAQISSQDGHAAGTLSSWALGEDGTITGTFSDGSTQTLAKVALANFDNPQGLSKEGGSMYSATVNSGTASIGSAGDAGRGTITSGALEMSNVDLSQEFTNLIIAQRGFQANSKVITTSDDILQTLIGLKQ
jgi:flagellar hook protein FlgE